MGRFISVDPKQSKENNPYEFVDSTTAKQVTDKPKKKVVKK
jgi:hypothetical protein